MQAATIYEYGGPDVFQLRQIDRPEPQEDQLLVRVQAAGINPIDWRIRSGGLRFLLPAKFPLVLGFDVAGEVAQVGPKAAEQGWQPGQPVLCFLDHRHGGAYAELATVGSDVAVRRPDWLSPVEAAAIPLAGSTAWQSLVGKGDLQAGQRVLVNGASGGVGTFAVGFAAALGAEVTAVCSESNFALVRRLGATETIDYHQRDFTRLDQTFHCVFDAVGKSSYRACRRLLTPTGHYITTLPSTRTFVYSLLTKFSRKHCHMILARPDGEDLRSMLQLMERHELRPVIQQTFPLADAAEAHRVSEDGHVVGKLVLVVA